MGANPVKSLRPDCQMRTFKYDSMRAHERTLEERAERRRRRKNVKGKGQLEQFHEETERMESSTKREVDILDLIPLREISSSMDIQPKKSQGCKKRVIASKVKKKVTESLKESNDLSERLCNIVEAENKSSTKSQSKGVVIRSLPRPPLPVHVDETTSSKSNGKRPMPETPVGKKKLWSSRTHVELPSEEAMKRSKEESVAQPSQEKTILPQGKMDWVWVILVPSKSQHGVPPLQPLARPYIKVNFNRSDPPYVSALKKHIASTLKLESNEKVIDVFLGDQLLPAEMKLLDVVNLWLKKADPKEIKISMGSSAKDFVMELTYARSI